MPGPRTLLVAALLVVACVLGWTLLVPPPRVLSDPATAGVRPTAQAPDAPTPAATAAADEPVPAPSSSGGPSGAMDGAAVPPTGAGGALRATLTGVVRDRQGRPIAGAIVRRPGARGGRNGRTITAGDGSFRLERLPTERLPYEVVIPRLDVRDDAVGFATFEGVAGGPPVDVVVDVGIETTLRWSDPSPAPRGVTVMVARTTGPVRLEPVFDANGAAALRGLAATDRLFVWASPDAAGRSVFVAGGKPGTELALTRTEGYVIAGGVRGLAAGESVSVWGEEMASGLAIAAEVQGASFRLLGVPAGTRWRLRAAVGGTGEDDTPGREGTLDDVAPGGHPEIELAPR